MMAREDGETPTKADFEAFLEEIAADLGWEYSDGEPMRDSAREYLAEVRQLREVAVARGSRKEHSVSALEYLEQGLELRMAELRARLAKEHPAAVLEYLDQILERDQYLREKGWSELLDHAAKRVHKNRLERERRARKRRGEVRS